MPGRQGSDDDYNTIAPAAGGHVAGGTRRAQTQPPYDLQSALDTPSPYCPKMWGLQELACIPGTLTKVKDPRDLLTLRAQLLASLGPQFLWIIMFIMVEWASLTDEEKQITPP
jgi:hypothetical protein